MTETGLTTGDFTEASEPYRLFAQWLQDATASEPNDPNALALATVDADGLPDVRMVLLKAAAALVLGHRSNRARSKAGSLSKRQSLNTPPNTPSATSRVRSIGRGSGLSRNSSSSGTTGHSGCMTALCLHAPLMIGKRPGFTPDRMQPAPLSWRPKVAYVNAKGMPDASAPT